MEYYSYIRYVFTIFFALSFCCSLITPASCEAAVGLYDVFETNVVNSNPYSNPFDFRIIELQANFTSPSGKQYAYYGFYDGDGVGGLTGPVWKLRFMPNEIGTWKYNYTWTDGTPGASGTFIVADTGLPGPLRIAADNPWYFEDSRGNPFRWRGYSLHLYGHWKYGGDIKTDKAWADLQDKIITQVANRGYNALMLGWPVVVSSNGNHFWQWNKSGVDFTRYYIPQWRNVEKTLEVAAANRVYVFQFLAMVHQETKSPNDTEMIPYLRYLAARIGPYWNNFGYSPTWEYHEIWTHSYADSVMTRLKDNLSGLPVPPLLTIHDHSNNLFAGWLNFSMRQRPSKSIFDGNVHGGGIQGGVGTAFLNLPVIGSEDIWEVCENDCPCNGKEVQRAAWGLMMAGVMPVYLEYTGKSGKFNGEGEPQIRRMFDFFYFKTRYRRYRQLNNMVLSFWEGIEHRANRFLSSFWKDLFYIENRRQVASGIPGLEYLIYDEDGGTITVNLSSTSSTDKFSVLWFDPTTGIESRSASIEGGGYRVLTSPFSEDTVLFLRKKDDETAPME